MGSDICAENKAEQEAMNTSGREVDSEEQCSRQGDNQMQGQALRQWHDWQEEEPGVSCVSCGGEEGILEGQEPDNLAMGHGEQFQFYSTFYGK